MKKLVLLAASLVYAQISFANSIEDRLKNAGESDMTVCRSSDAPEKTSYLVTKGGEIYTSNSSEKNPRRIKDFVLFGMAE